jgi:plasmid stabilization system protein ParE
MSDVPGRPSEEYGARRYAVRLLARARRDRAATAAWIIEHVGADEEGNPTEEGERIAADWLAHLSDALGTLAENPERHPILPAESKRLGVPVRRILFRRNNSSRFAHHVYYTVEEHEDGPRVVVVHIRSASRRPLTVKEARELREEL